MAVPPLSISESSVVIRCTLGSGSDCCPASVTEPPGRSERRIRLSCNAGVDMEAARNDVTPAPSQGPKQDLGEGLRSSAGLGPERNPSFGPTRDRGQAPTRDGGQAPTRGPALALGHGPGSGPGPRPRAGAAVRSGRLRARTVAIRLGIGLRDARLTAGRTQKQLAASAGISQARESELERGGGAGTSIETWSSLGAAVGEQFVGFFERAPGAAQPRDIEHLRRQSALIELASVGGWSALPELAVDPGSIRSRSIDVVLMRPATREAVAAEVWDWFDDVGAALRGLDAKRRVLEGRLDAESAAARNLEPAWRVRGLFLVRDTRRNRTLVAELRPLFAARFSGSAVDWLRALGSPTTRLPDGHGFVWSDAKNHFIASRLGRPKG